LAAPYQPKNNGIPAGPEKRTAMRRSSGKLAAIRCLILVFAL
jgi:hypothetical protein